MKFLSFAIFYLLRQIYSPWMSMKFAVHCKAKKWQEETAKTTTTFTKKQQQQQQQHWQKCSTEITRIFRLLRRTKMVIGLLWEFVVADVEKYFSHSSKQKKNIHRCFLPQQRKVLLYHRLNVYWYLTKQFCMVLSNLIS